MKTIQKLCFAALLVVLVSGSAEARGKPVKGGGGGGGIATNYGCKYLTAGTVLRSPDSLSQTTVTTTAWTCYICNLTTRVCAVQAPSPYAGWTFTMP